MRTSTFRHLLGAPVAVLLLGATAIGCQSSASDQAHDATPPSPDQSTSSAPQTTYVPQYGVRSHAYKPRRLNPSVDGSLYLTGMHWGVWTNRRAVGHGVAHVNDCKPDCASAHYATHRVTVRLTKPRDLCGSRFFTAIGVRGSGYHAYARQSGVGCS